MVDSQFPNYPRQGVFVVPFQPPSNKAGPSTLEPLDEIYDKAYQHFQAAHDVSMLERMAL